MSHYQQELSTQFVYFIFGGTVNLGYDFESYQEEDDLMIHSQVQSISQHDTTCHIMSEDTDSCSVLMVISLLNMHYPDATQYPPIAASA